MIPEKLNISNFMCYDKASIDFSKFNSALIVGKINNNLDISNGSGKTSIFNAIEYSLFNECGDIKLEKIVRDGQPSCYVDFIFKIDSVKYRIKRSRTAKGTSSVQLYKCLDLDKEDWSDISGRRNSDTEDQIKKVIKITNKSFRNTTHFVQRDFSGITTLTPTKRKEILKEIFDLSFYTKLEKAANAKLNFLSKEDLKLSTLIDSFGNLEEIKCLESLNLEKINLEKITITNSINNIKDQILKLSEDKKIKTSIIDESKNNLDKLLAQEKLINSQLSEVKSKIDFFEGKKKDILIKLDLAKKTLIDLPKIDEEIDNKINLTQSLISELKESKANLVAKTSSLQKEIIKLDKALNLESCEFCLQKVSAAHCESLRIDLNNAKDILSTSEFDLSNLNKSLLEKEKELSKLKTIKISQDADIKNINVAESNINIYNNNIFNINNNINDLINNKEKYLSIICDFQIQKQLIDSELINSTKLILENIDNDILSKTKELKILTNELNNLNNKESVINYKINEIDSNIKKAKELNEKKLSIQDDLQIYPLLSEAFSSKGIPSFIINNLLDDVQEHANNICNKIKPGLQIQFLLQKENNSGNEVETLDIKYFLNGQERDFNQLSGAMKFNATFSLKLALSIITQKIMGSEIKFFLFDEIDSSLDKFSSNEFIKIIKELENDYKILLITHGDSLKDKFYNKILVCQDINGASTIIQD